MQILLVVLTPLIATVCVLYTFVDEIDLDARLIYGPAGAVAAMAGFVLACRSLIRNPPELVLDADGVSAIYGLGRVAIGWHQIAAVRIGRYGPEDCVQIIVYAQTDKPARAPRDLVISGGWTAIDGHRAFVLSPMRMHPHRPADIIYAMTMHHPALFVAPPA